MPQQLTPEFYNKDRPFTFHGLDEGQTSQGFWDGSFHMWQWKKGLRIIINAWGHFLFGVKIHLVVGYRKAVVYKDAKHTHTVILTAASCTKRDFYTTIQKIDQKSKKYIFVRKALRALFS